MDKLLSMLQDYLTAAQKTIITYAPQVWHTTLQLIQFTSIWYLVLGFICLILAVMYCWYWIHKAFKEEDTDYLFFLVFSVVFILPALIILLNVYNWIGAFYPQLAVLYKIAERAGLL